MAGSLFDRLTQGEAGTRMSEDESIRRHLMRLFTARQGSVTALPDYGLPDLNDLTLSRAEIINETCRAVSACIAAYEPRLTEVRVVHQPRREAAFSLDFRISALRREPGGGTSPWQWSLSIEGDKVREQP